MQQIDILKAFLSDPELKEKYEISDADIAEVKMTGNLSNNMMCLVRDLLSRRETNKQSTRIAANQLAAYLDSIL